MYKQKTVINIVARVINTSVEQTISIYMEQIKLTQVSNY